MRKKILLSLGVCLLLYVTVCVLYGRVWHVKNITMQGSTVMVDWDEGYQAPSCGGASSCSSEQRSAVKALLRLNPLWWFVDIEFSVEGMPLKGHYTG